MVRVYDDITEWHLKHVSEESRVFDAIYHSSDREIGALFVAFSVLEHSVDSEDTRWNKAMRL